MKLCNYEAAAEVIKGLLRGDNDITALNSGKYLTTRMTNIICDLRQLGLEIRTEMRTAPSGKKYGAYRLVQSDRNIARAIELLEMIESRL